MSREIISTPHAPADTGTYSQAKTAGNPFFLRALLGRLEREGWLAPDQTGWSWDLEGVRGLGVSENVADLRLETLRDLPADQLD